VKELREKLEGFPGQMLPHDLRIASWQGVLRQLSLVWKGFVSRCLKLEGPMRRLDKKWSGCCRSKQGLKPRSLVEPMKPEAKASGYLSVLGQNKAVRGVWDDSAGWHPERYQVRGKADVFWDWIGIQKRSGGVMKLGMKLKVLMVVLAVGMAVSARAQVAPYAMFSLGHYSGQGVGPGTSATQSSGITAFGGTFGVYDDMLKAGPVKIGPDARFFIDNSANSTQYGNKIDGFLVGGRLEVNMVALPFRPYGQAEFGVASTNNGTQSNKNSSFAYQFQFGGDFTLIPHVGARVEYGAGQMETGGGTSHTLQSFGAGIVVRL